MRNHYLAFLGRSVTQAVIFAVGLFSSLAILAEDQATFAQRSTCSLTAWYTYPASVIGDRRLTGQPKWNFFGAVYQGDGLLGSASFGLSLFVPAGSGEDGFRPTDLPGSWYGSYTQPGLDREVAQSFILGPSYDPFETFNDPNKSAAAEFRVRARLNDLLRAGSAAPPASVWVSPAADTYDAKAGNHFEAGMTAQFVFRTRSRYPVTVTLPVNMEVRDDPDYTSGHFGYISGGVNVQVPLSFVPRRYGKWSASTSAGICYFGTTKAEFVDSINLQIPKIAAALSVDL